MCFTIFTKKEFHWFIKGLPETILYLKGFGNCHQIGKKNNMHKQKNFRIFFMKHIYK